MRLNTQIEMTTRQIFCLRDVALDDEILVFVDASGRLVFIRHDYLGESDVIAASHAVVIGGDESPAFPLTAVPPFAVTLHQGADPMPPLTGPEVIDATTAERLWRDRRGCAVLIGRTEEGLLRAVTVGGSEPEFPCMSRGAGAVLVLGEAGAPV